MAATSHIALCTALALLVSPAVAQATGTWRRPVPGEVLLHFSYGPDPFRAGQHRGVDLAARPGERVRSACSGRVTFAAGTDGGSSGVPGASGGRGASGRTGASGAGASSGSGATGATGSALSVRCGSWRVSYLPVHDVRVRAGSAVRRGTVLGRVRSDRRHAGLHLGVRREGRRWAYVDPLALLTPVPPPRLPPSPAPRGRGRPPANPRTAPRPVPSVSEPGAHAVPRPAPVGMPVAVIPPEPRARPEPTSGPLAPWPVWVGLGLLLSGALGAGASRQRTGLRHARRTPSATALARAE